MQQQSDYHEFTSKLVHILKQDTNFANVLPQDINLDNDLYEFVTELYGVVTDYKATSGVIGGDFYDHDKKFTVSDIKPSHKFTNTEIDNYIKEDGIMIEINKILLSDKPSSIPSVQSMFSNMSHEQIARMTMVLARNLDISSGNDVKYRRKAIQLILNANISINIIDTEYNKVFRDLDFTCFYPLQQREPTSNPVNCPHIITASAGAGKKPRQATSQRAPRERKRVP